MYDDKEFKSNKAVLLNKQPENKLQKLFKSKFKFRDRNKEKNENKSESNHSNDNDNRYFKRSTYIIEEELIFKKKIISVVEENFHKSKNNYDNKCNNNEEQFNRNTENNTNCKKKGCHIFSIFKICFRTSQNDCDNKAKSKKILFADENSEVLDTSKAETFNNSDMTCYKDLFQENSMSSRHTLTKHARHRNSDDTSKNIETESSQGLLDKDYKYGKLKHKELVPTRVIVGSLKYDGKTDDKDKLTKPQDLEALQKLDSEDMFLESIQKTIIRDTYIYQRFLGEGTFGKVWACLDLKCNSKLVALKINKSSPKYHKLAMHEVKLLNRVKKNDFMGKNHVVIFLDWFEVDKHVIIVFPEYGDNLYKYMKSNDYLGMQICDVRHISYQMWKAVDYLHQSTIIHTDIKPENVLLVTKDYKFIPTPPATRSQLAVSLSTRQEKHRYRVPIQTDVVLIDLGNGITETDAKPKLIVTRYYRPPEVYLEIGWDETVDIWSVGCVMFELYLGRSLFQCRGDAEHIWMMEYVLKLFPMETIRKSKLYETFFDEKGRVRHNNIDVQKLKKRLTVFDYLMNLRTREDDQLVNLIMMCLKFNSKDRISIQDALNSPFYNTDRN